MKVVFIEIRDAATCIPAMAIKMQAANEGQRYLMRRCGYPDDGSSIILMRLSSQQATSDYSQWDSRTMQVAHHWLDFYFDEVQDGHVLDVEFILGLSDTAKASERFE